MYRLWLSVPARWTGRRAGVVLVVVFLAVPSSAAAQPDTSTTAPSPVAASDHSPQGALLRAAVLPGWGQLYNRQYLKIPLVYLGLGGLTAAALYVNDRYLLYRHAFLYKAYQERIDQGLIEEHPFPYYEGDYRTLEARFGPVSSRPLRDQRDKLRRNRDLLYFGIGLWYGLTVLDAYVSAHLLDFDVSEDLTVSVTPTLVHPGVGARLRLAF